MQTSTADRWSDPSYSERRFFERRDSDPLRQSWTSDTDLRADAERYATPSSTRRSAVARGIGFIGVLGVLGLAVVAFAPRMPVAASKLAMLANRIELPWDPALQPGPAPIPLERRASLAAPLATTPLDAAPTDATPLQATQIDAAAVVAPPVESTAERITKAVTAPSIERSSEAALSSMPQPAEEPANRSATSSERRVSESANESREPTLTPEEIERRKQRYEQWLESERLERVR
jgi:hypothetical protein